MDILMLWGSKIISLISTALICAKAFLCFYKNFEDIFSTHPDLHQGYGAEFMLQLIERIVHHYSTLRGNIYEEFPVVVGYGVGLPTSYIPQFEDVMGAEM